MKKSITNTLFYQPRKFGILKIDELFYLIDYWIDMWSKNVPIYEILSTRCVNHARCENHNGRMYIISSMEVLVSLVIICRSLSLHWPGFSSHHFVKRVYWSANKMLVPLCTYVLKEFTIQIWKPNFRLTFTLFGVPWGPSIRHEQKWLHIVLSPAFGKRVAWYLMRRIETVCFHPCRQLLWNFHPSNEGSPNHWAKESRSWYLVLTKYAVNETEVEG
jgi:hypothetical protein